VNFSTVRQVHRLHLLNGSINRRAASALGRVRIGAFGAIKATAVLAIAVTIGLAGTGGTYAYLNSSAMASSSSMVSAGTAALAVGPQSLNWSALAPGDSVTGTFTITNTGDVPLVLSATIAATIAPAIASPFTISVANGVCLASGVPAGTLNSTLAASSTTSACLVVTLPVNAPANAQSASAAIAVSISGVQS